MLKLVFAAGLPAGAAFAGSAPLAAQEPVPAQIITQSGPGYWYPAAAMRNGEQGQVGFKVEVAEDGRAVSCTVTEPSPSATLNKATCEQFVRWARFEPATDESGSPVPGSYKSRVVWMMPVENVSGEMPSSTNLPFSAYANGRSKLVIGYKLTIDPSGSATSCEVAYPSGDEGFDAVVCDAIMEVVADTRFTEGFDDLDGEPFMRTFKSSVVWNDPARFDKKD
ncbi:TonB family protein [Alteriqipengyuania sp.]|uniref:TonB family protein n=1 Tax=Alteriqipengyuania sp. TaxID=2800692 RepID=UPI0035139B3B